MMWYTSIPLLKRSIVCQIYLMFHQGCHLQQTLLHNLSRISKPLVDLFQSIPTDSGPLNSNFIKRFLSQFWRHFPCLSPSEIFPPDSFGAIFPRTTFATEMVAIIDLAFIVICLQDVIRKPTEILLEPVSNVNK